MKLAKGNQNARKHGHTSGRWSGKPRSPEYVSWQAMIARCENPKAKRYERYGGRGIKVCKRWRTSFANFLADIGPRPKGTTLDRINNDGDYEPSNCRWGTRKQQYANRSKPGPKGPRLSDQERREKKRKAQQLWRKRNLAYLAKYNRAYRRRKTNAL